MDFVKKSNAKLFLFLNAFLWGSSYVWSKLLLGYLPRFTILLLCSIGGLVTTFIIFFPSIRRIKAREILPSLSVTAFSILSNTFFMLALQYTSSSNTAFIVQSTVVITPVIMAICDKRMPRGKVIISAMTALAGLFLITCSFNDFRLNPGDVFAFLNAIFFSLFLTGQNRISSKVDSVHFSFLYHGFNTVVFLTLAAVMEFRQIEFSGLLTYKFLLPALASIFIAVATVLFQSAAIRFVRPEGAILIYTLEPITTLLLASVLIGEQLKGLQSIAGFVLILTAVLLSILRLPVRRNKIEKVRLKAA